MSTKPAGPVSVPDVIAQLPHPWQQRDLAFANGTVLRVVRFEGAFPWHQRDQDELYLCWDGSFRVEFEGGDSVVLRAGDIFVVPKGVRHRPVADEPAYGLMLERPEAKQYGNA
jgi:quercetin dioxygenase-like cupin family protein